VIADKLPLTLDKNGAGKLSIDAILPPNNRKTCCWKPLRRPNGEVQTIRSTQTLWPRR